MIDFIAVFLFVSCIVGIIAKVIQMFELATIIQFIVVFFSVGFAITAYGNNIGVIIASLIFIVMISGLYYVALKQVAETKSVGPIVKITNIVDTSLLFLNMSLIMGMLFATGVEDEFNQQFLVGVVVYYFLFWFMNYGVVSNKENLSNYIVTQRFTTLEEIKILKQFKATRFIPQSVDENIALLEYLELVNERGSNFEIIKDRYNAETAICFEKTAHHELRSRIIGIMKKSDVQEINNIIEMIEKTMKLKIEAKEMITYINFGCEGIHCFDNYVVTDKLMKELDDDIKLSLRQNDFDENIMLTKYKISNEALNGMTNYLGYKIMDK